MPGSPTRDTITTTGDMQSSPFTSGPKSAAGPNVDHRSNNDLSKLSAPQVRELREGFQLLDRDSDGLVTREDVVEMLNSLGQDSSARNVATFFPPSTPHPLTLPPFLTNLSALLAPISASDELLSAFAAFDDDDSGTVDVGELRDALLNTAPEDFGERPMTEVQVESAMRDFVGRKAFGGGHGKANRGGTRGDVFKYKDFVDSVRGGAQNGGVEVPTG
ncbi:MAG: hypothetical protein M1837_002758 [Sclerophora amabilis]|nr:MAG: hypothetical protein M1837_002758 [Sclerophora amabilis]